MLQLKKDYFNGYTAEEVLSNKPPNSTHENWIKHLPFQHGVCIKILEVWELYFISTDLCCRRDSGTKS